MAKAGFVPLLVAFLGAPVVGQTPRPVKLEVDPPPRSIVVGERASINVRLLDADNRLVAAPKDFTVNIVTRLPSSRNETLASAVLKAAPDQFFTRLLDTVKDAVWSGFPGQENYYANSAFEKIFGKKISEFQADPGCVTARSGPSSPMARTASPCMRL